MDDIEHMENTERLKLQLDSDDWKIRRAAVAVLGKTGDADAVPPLISALADKSFRVRSAVVHALGNTGDPRAVEPLINFMENRFFPVRWDVIRVLRKPAFAGVTEPFVQALKHKNYHIRRAAAGILHHNGWLPADDSQKAYYLTAKKHWRQLSALGQDATPALVNVLKDKKISIRKAAIKLLGKIGDSSAVSPLIEGVCGKLTDSLLYLKTLRSLTKINTAGGFSTFVETLKHKNRHVRSQAEKILADLDWKPSEDGETALVLTATEKWDKLPPLGKAAVPPLVNILWDASERIRNRAVETLGNIGDDSVVEPLIHVLETNAPRVRRTAAQALGKIGDPRAINPLLNALLDDSERVWREAGCSLNKFKTGPTGGLIEALNNTAPVIREHAAMVLGNIGEAAALEPLITAFESDESEETRGAAAVALGQIGDVRAVDILLPALDDDGSSIVQQKAVTALGLIGDPRAVGPLLALRNDFDLVVRMNAVEALGRIAAPGILGHLIAALEDGYQGVREAAAVAIGNAGDSRAVKPLLKESMKNTKFKRWQKISHDALEKLRSRLIVETVDFVCHNCFLRYQPHTDELFKLSTLRYEIMTYWTCPSCLSDTQYLVRIETIAVLLDRNFKEPYIQDGTTLLVNWFEWNDTLDYTEIRIVDADDYDVENLLVKLSNDMDDERRTRLPKVPVYLSSGVRLSPAKMNLLKENFLVKIIE